MYILHYTNKKTGNNEIKKIPLSCKTSLNNYLKNNKNIDKKACIYGLPIGILNFN